MTGEMREALAENASAVQRYLAKLEAKIDFMDLMIRGNGVPGLNSRVVTIETTIKILAGLLALMIPVTATISLAVGCEVAKRLAPIPTATASH